MNHIYSPSVLAIGLGLLGIAWGSPPARAQQAGQTIRATIPALDVSGAFLSISRFRLFAATSTASAGLRLGILGLACRLLFGRWIGSAVVFWIEVVAGHCSRSLVVI